MRHKRIIIVGNFLDDETRAGRGITGDSPAASRKIVRMAEALRSAGTATYVLSMGRGAPKRLLDWHSARVVRINKVPIAYAPFSNLPIVSEITTLVGLAVLAIRLRRDSNCTIVFYNRFHAYLPVLVIGTLFGNRMILDLEDGQIAINRSKIGAISQRLIRWVFDRCCKHGALLACSKLRNDTAIRPVFCYYGTSAVNAVANPMQSIVVTCLMAGTLDFETGATTLIDAIEKLRAHRPALAKQLRFIVTGKGTCAHEFERLAAADGQPEVVFYGRIPDEDYSKVLSLVDVGLALKRVDGTLSNTTFPSKVIEFGAAGLLVLTTDISDVRQMLGKGALYLRSNDPELLVELLSTVVMDRSAAVNRARLGSENIRARCAPELAGPALAKFIHGRQ